MTNMVGMAGGIVGGIGTWLAAEAQADTYLSNAKAAERDAIMAREAAAAEAQDIRYEAEFVKGEQRARSASMGFVPDEGTGLALLEEAERQATKGILRTEYAGEVEYTRYMYEHSLYRRAAGTTRLMGIIGGWSQALSGGGVQSPSPGIRERPRGYAESQYQQDRLSESDRADRPSSTTPEPGAGLGTTGSSGASDESWDWN